MRQDRAPGSTNTTNGACGSANNGTFSSAPTTNLCNTGTPTAVTDVGNAFIWQCTGSTLGDVDACLANKGTGGSSSGASSSGGTGTPIQAPLTGTVTPGTWQSGDLPFSGLTSGMPFHYNYMLPDGYSTANIYPVIIYEHTDFEGTSWYDGKYFTDPLATRK